MKYPSLLMLSLITVCILDMQIVQSNAFSPKIQCDFEAFYLDTSKGKRTKVTPLGKKVFDMGSGRDFSWEGNTQSIPGWRGPKTQFIFLGHVDSPQKYYASFNFLIGNEKSLKKDKAYIHTLGNEHLIKVSSLIDHMNWFIQANCHTMRPQQKLGNKISISRTMTIKTCFDKSNHCTRHLVKNLEKSNLDFHLSPYSKGSDTGVFDRNTTLLIDNGTQFKSTINILKKDHEKNYYVYVMLRSGEVSQRRGVIKTFHISNLSDFQRVKIIDKPISFKKGTLQLELTLGPKRDILTR